MDLECLPEWPVHAPMVKTIDLKKLNELSQTSAYKEDVRTAVEMLSYSEYHYGKEMPPLKLLTESDELTEEDVQIFINNGLLEEDPDVRGGGRMSPVGEKAKQRRRVIHDLLWLNATSPEPERVQFHSIAELHLITETCSYATALDMKCWFYQFVIDISLGRCCGILHNGKRYRMKRLPMGLKHAVFVAQAVLRCLSDVGVEGVTASMYIDNIMFAGNCPKAINRARALFIQRCKFINATIGDHGTLATTVVEFRGLKLDLGQKQVSMGSKFLEKFEYRIELLQTAAVRNSVSAWETIIGMETYALCCLRRPLGLNHNTYKWMAHAISNNSVFARPPPTAWNELRNIARISKTKSEVQFDWDQQERLYTDAARTSRRAGWGGLRIKPSGESTMSKGVFERLENGQFAHINILETQAVERAVREMYRSVNPNKLITPITLYIDNTAAQSSVGRGGSSAFYLNKAAVDVWNIAMEKRLFLFPKRIASKDNIVADALSRGIPAPNYQH